MTTPITDMPILGRTVEGCPTSVSLETLNEQWAIMIHDQSLSRLAERGGMTLGEIVANIEQRSYRFMSDDELRTVFTEFNKPRKDT